MLTLKIKKIIIIKKKKKQTNKHVHHVVSLSTFTSVRVPFLDSVQTQVEARTLGLVVVV